MAGCQESPGELFLLAVTAQGVVTGSSHCSFRLDRARYRHRAELALSVRQDYWRQGLGRRLMEIQETWCRSQGIEKLCLEVDTKNLRAMGLYLSRGFVVEGTLRRAVKMADGSYRDLYVMGKFLDRWKNPAALLGCRAAGFLFPSLSAPPSGFGGTTLGRYSAWFCGCSPPWRR